MVYMIPLGSLDLTGENVGFSVVCIFIGLLFIPLGLALRHVPFNNAGVGIKFPWILHDEAAWNVTHRASSTFWVIGGILSIAFAFLPVTPPFVIVYLVLFFACIGLGPLVVSLRAHHTKRLPP